METINRFLEVHKSRECSYSDFVQYYLNDSKLHNHTLENLFLYFSLEDHLRKGRVHFYYSVIFINDNRRYKWFINSVDLDIDKVFDFSILSEDIKKKMIFYSSSELISDFLIKSKFKETVYNLVNIFDIQIYFDKYKNKKVSEIKKKFYNRVKYPFIYLSRLNFVSRDIDEKMLDEIEQLHKDWCTYKLEDPKTFKMMFSSNRYYRCLEQSFTSEYLKYSTWYRKAFYLDGKLIAVRQCLIQGDTSYDIGFFSRFWDTPSNIVNYINTWCMYDLLHLGVRFHNCGAEMDKNLGMFKSHFPNFYRYGYKYNFKK